MFDELMNKIQNSLAVTKRTQNQLPPITSKRQGSLAHLEFWCKKQVRRITHWFTWEQVNFNAATHDALEQICVSIAQLEKQQADLRSETTQLNTRLQQLVDEQRLCFKQLSLEVSEGMIVSDRARRNIQLQLDQLSANLTEIQTLAFRTEDQETSPGRH